MKLPNKNRVCFFCKYSRPEFTDGIVWCQNETAIHKRRAHKYGTKNIYRLSGENRLASSTCRYFEEKPNAASKLVEIKLTGKYRSRDHERETGGTLRSHRRRHKV
jgi:hypothetical protein